MKLFPQPEIGKTAGLVEGEGSIWLPVIEDASLEGSLLTGLLQEDVRTGNINQVPILIGFNSEEEILFMAFGNNHKDIFLQERKL